jgi:AcrR family transcriptional regulator
MAVSRQDARAGQRERTRSAVLAAARDLLAGAVVPSVADAAEAAGVSRATAYRYFPTRGALIGEALWDVMPEWNEDSFDSLEPGARVDELQSQILPLLAENEALFRAAVMETLEEWRARHSGEVLSGPPIRRGGRIGGIRAALAPVRDRLSEAEFDRLVAAVAVCIGIESQLALRDVVGLSRRKQDEVVRWMAQAVIRQALAEAEG